MIFTILISLACGFSGSYLFYRLRARTFYGKWLPVVKDGAIPNAVYFVRQVEPAGFVKVIYEGDDLQTAKKEYKAVNMPKPTLVEFYTHGQHTASRNI